MSLSRRKFVAATALAVCASDGLTRAARAARATDLRFKPTWESLRDYIVPDWWAQVLHSQRADVSAPIPCRARKLRTHSAVARNPPNG